MASSVDMEDADDVVMIDRGDVADFNLFQRLPEDPATVEAMRKWLHPTEYDLPSGEYHKHLASHVKGTGSWLTSSTTYQQWLESDEYGLVWIRGFAGSGKSVMAAHIIDELQNNNPGTPVLYFFFRQIIDANHEPDALLRDWQAQLLNYSPPLQKQLKDYRTRGGLGSLSMQDHWNNLRNAAEALPGKVFCVADALDEMNAGNDDFLRSLAEFGQWKPGKVKVLVTSRPVPTLEAPLRNCKALHLRLEEDMVNTDIKSYIQESLRRSSIPEKDWDKVFGAVPGRADGLFIYAKLAMDAFVEPGAEVDEVLKNLPANLKELYNKLLDEHARRSGVDRDIQLLILQWVTHATRPLRLLEVADMINVTFMPPEEQNLKRTKDLVRAAIGPLLEVFPDQTLCVIHHSFTEFLKDTSREDSPGEFHILKHALTHQQLALACLRYLSSGCLDEVVVREDSDQESDDMSEDSYCSHDTNEHSDMWSNHGIPEADSSRGVEAKLNHAFLSYASSNWYIHVQRAASVEEEQSQLNEALDEFLKSDGRKAWLTLQWDKKDDTVHQLTPLHIAAKYGLTAYASHLLSSHDSDVDGRDGQGRTAMWWAAKYGHDEIIRSLVGHGADPNLDDYERGLAPLHVATLWKHAKAAKVLLEAGVDPLTRRNMSRLKRFAYAADSGSEALRYACREGDMATLEAIVPFLKSMDDINRALGWASKCGHAKLVRRLLQQPGIDINTKILGDTPLILACGATSTETIQLLIEGGADPSVCGFDEDSRNNVGGPTSRDPTNKVQDPSRSYTALHAIFDWRKGSGLSRICNTKSGMTLENFRYVVNALLQGGKGVDINKRTITGKTALHFACKSTIGKADGARALLEAGADPNIVDDSGQGPIHNGSCSADVFALLLDYGVDINKQAGSNGKSMLHEMFRHGNAKNLPQLLKYKPDLSDRDEQGNTLLHTVLSNQYNLNLEHVRMLLEDGADLNEHNFEGDTCLHVATFAFSNDGVLLDMLLKAGANINAKNTKGETPLFKRVANPYFNYSDITMMEMLLDRGADIGTRDFKGRTLLHAAVILRDCGAPGNSCFHSLVKRGLDTALVDYRGNTLFHELARMINIHRSEHAKSLMDTWKYLTENGADPQQKNNTGRSPLHLLCSKSHDPSQGSPSAMPALDFFLSVYEDLNIADNFGIAPLHLAVTVSEFTTKKLLEAGANIAQITHDGLTALHLAARARQANALGLLLQSPASDGNTLVDARDRNGLTPLYYACRSGVLQSVTFLLDAGANLNVSDLFQAAAEFEEEQELWMQAADVDRPIPTNDVMQWQQQRIRDDNLDAGGLTCKDKTRPGVKPELLYFCLHPELDPPRIDEIIDVLLKHGADVSALETHISAAVENRRHYTVACLCKALKRLPLDSSAPVSLDIRLAERTISLSQAAEIQAALEYVDSDISMTKFFVNLFKRRKYAVLEAVIQASGLNYLGMLVRNGYLDLVDRIGTSILTKDVTSQPNILDIAVNSAQPLLLAALSRNSPNMEVVRLLVEKFKADFNASKQLDSTIPGEFLGQKAGVTALHIIARGQHWWHVALALPFLLERGANLEARNEGGDTPLHVALAPLAFCSSPTDYTVEVAKALISAGADVNAINGQSKSCVALASSNQELTRLLFRNGAELKPVMLLEAVHSQSVGTLKDILDRGLDPNVMTTRKVSGEKAYRCPLLFYAAVDHGVSKDSYTREYDQPEKTRLAVQVAEALLAHRADPFKEFEDTRDKTGRTATVLHELIVQDEVVHPILLLPGLDFNHRNAQGLTVLHAICQNRHGADAPIDSLALQEGEVSQLPSFLQIALDSGADALARDNLGRNALHHSMLSSMRLGEYSPTSLASNGATIATLASRYPTLLDQQDHDGKPPLHLAMEFAVRTRDFEPAQALIEAGADVTLLDNDDNTVLHILSRLLIPFAQARDLFRHLAQYIDINSTNCQGETPAFSVFKQNSGPPGSRHTKNTSGQVEIKPENVREYLEELGADLTVKDNEGRSLLHHAASSPKYWFACNEYFQALLNAGLDPMEEDDAQRTPVDIATACNNRDVLRLFEKNPEKRDTALSAPAGHSGLDLLLKQQEQVQRMFGL